MQTQFTPKLRTAALYSLLALTLIAISVVQPVSARPEAESSATKSVGSECGPLGEMKLPGVLPAGVDLNPDRVRKCADHPLMLIPSELKDEKESNVATINAGSSLTKRDCEFAAPYGCSKNGFCWKVCDSAGGWCWTAKNGGVGDWETCSSFNDCNTGMACGIGNCAACGCSC